MTVTSGRKAIYLSINMTRRLMQASAQQGFLFSFSFFPFYLSRSAVLFETRKERQTNKRKKQRWHFERCGCMHTDRKDVRGTRDRHSQQGLGVSVGKEGLKEDCVSSGKEGLKGDS